MMLAKCSRWAAWVAVALLTSQLVSVVNAEVGEIYSSPLANGPQAIYYFGQTKNVLLWESVSKLVWHSKDEGRSWTAVKEFPEGVATRLIQHPFARESTAVILTSGTNHWITKDAGATWKSFTTALPPALKSPAPLSFNARKTGYVLFTGEKCSSTGWLCHMEVPYRYDARIFRRYAQTDTGCIQTFYTKDSFDHTEPLLPYTFDCLWASGSAGFKTDSDDTILCSQWPEDLQKDGATDVSSLRLVKSNEYFPSGKGDIILLGGGIAGLGVVERFMFAAVMSPDPGHGMSFFVSTDGKTFKRAKFPFHTSAKKEGAYTVLESSDSSLAVDVSTKGQSGNVAPYGTLYFSDTDGLQYVEAANLEHTNRGPSGRIDFERIQASMYEGIYLANIVQNWEDVDSGSEKRLVTKMSFGGQWSLLRPPARDATNADWPCTPAAIGSAVETKCSLHLHSVTEPHNIGRIFSTTGAPGFLLGVGSVGAYLRPYTECDTFLSTDGGRTWSAAAKGPHKYESLDSGSVLVLVPDNGLTDHILYSLDHGKTPFLKREVQLGDKKRWIARATILDPDSTSTKMLLAVEDSANSNFIVQLDFQNAAPRACEHDPNNPVPNKDFEFWSPEDDKGNPACYLGKNAKFLRRKAEALCSANLKKLPAPVVIDCACTVEDYECDVEFTRKVAAEGGLVCDQPSDPAFDQPPFCPVGEPYEGKTGYRKIPGNRCQKDIEKYKSTMSKTCTASERPGGIVVPPTGHEPTATQREFDATVASMLYFRKSSVILAQTLTGDLYRSADEGATWSAALQDYWPIRGMGLHETKDDRAFFFGTGKDKDGGLVHKVYYTDNGLSTPEVTDLNTPMEYNDLGLDIIDFHPDKPDWYTFLGGARDCGVRSVACHTTAFTTKDNGKSWSPPLETWANKCIWARDVDFKNPSIAEDTMYCTAFRYKNSAVGQARLLRGGITDGNTVQLVEVLADGSAPRVLVAKGVKEFYVVAGVMVVAVEDGSDLKLLVSTDGSHFEDAKYPPNMKVEKNAFTILQSSTSIFLDVGKQVNGRLESGTLFKSNENGTFYSRMLQNTNMNSNGQVDFEKMQGVGGVILANKVGNAEDIGSRPKQLQTVISFDDGSTWGSIAPPAKDSVGKSYACTDNPTACKLHLYSRPASMGTVHIASADMHSNAHAAGVMIAVGNVGQSLADYTDSDVFITRDAGHSWTEAFKDAHRWAIGDAGGLIVIVNDEGPTDVARYSWDFGRSWASFKFVDQPIRVTMVATQPSSTSRKFVIVGKHTHSGNSQHVAVIAHLDFSNLLTDVCAEGNSFETLNDGDRCYLGRKVTYRRRKQDAFCYVGDQFKVGEVEGAVCDCTDADYECDYGFFRHERQNTCEISGTHPGQPAQCAKGQTYLGPSGYRKISASKCEKELADKSKPREHMCGESDQYANGISLSKQVLDSNFKDYFYFNAQTVVLQTLDDTFRISRDGGMSWVEILEDRDVTAVIRDQFYDDRAWFLTATNEVIYTDDAGANFRSITVKEPVARGRASYALRSHKHQKSWLLWHGESKDCKSDEECFATAWYSTDMGKNWNSLVTYAEKCDWADDGRVKVPSEKVVFCIDRSIKEGSRKAGVKRLIRFSDFTASKYVAVLESVSDFVVVEEFVIAVMKHGSGTKAVVHVTLDGNEWAEAQFPADTQMFNGYTVLESTTGTVFLATYDNKGFDQEYGSLFTSNGNGTIFTKRLGGVNMNRKGNVDFEKMQGIEGIALLNSVANPAQVNSGASKVIRTLASFNDGVAWKPLAPPASGSYGCSTTNRDQCSLHLHSYTSRNDVRDQFSATSAVGMMIGVGGVGASLPQYRDSSTFLTRDAGRTWFEIAKHANKWEYGDHGGILLLVNDAEATTHVKYSLNLGESFQEMDITQGLGGKIKIDRVFSEPKGTGTVFVLVGTVRQSGFKDTTVALSLDFGNVFAGTTCTPDDFETWSPSGADEGDGNDACFFGQQIAYPRRKAQSSCLIGSDTKAALPQVKVQACACTKFDYECEYNHEPVTDSSGKRTCQLIASLAPRPAVCVGTQLRAPTAYSKLAKSHCQGGVALEVGETVGSCGRKSLGFFSWVFILLASIAGAAGITALFMRYRGLLFGKIRLPVDDYEDGPGSPNYRGSQDFSQRATGFLRAAFLVAVGVGELVSEKVGSVYDAVVARTRRGSGYAPVGQDPLHSNDLLGVDDDALMDLEDY
ncbi:vacuolar protein sorting/targeting protein PEP1 [Thoreauomyces humboldtii]|nr:vacuolar protein sorting/targeting protein PEP1 [Thoreauomyces humboldtii]